MPSKITFAESLPAIILVAAVAENGVIGSGNALPWRLRSDMQHFRALTMGKPVIMGRKTYLSIGKPLSGRTTIVVSRDREFAAPGVVVAPSLDAALVAARGDALRRRADAIVVAGGAEIYAQAMPLASRLVITQRARRVDGRRALSSDRSRHLARNRTRRACAGRRRRRRFRLRDLPASIRGRGVQREKRDRAPG